MIKAPSVRSLEEQSSKSLWNLEHQENFTSSSLARFQHFLKMTLKSIHKILSCKQTNVCRHVTSLVNVITLIEEEESNYQGRNSQFPLKIIIKPDCNINL